MCAGGSSRILRVRVRVDFPLRGGLERRDTDSQVKARHRPRQQQGEIRKITKHNETKRNVRCDERPGSWKAKTG